MGDIAVGIFQETLEQLIVGSGVRSISKNKCRLRSLRDEIKCMRGFLKVTEKKRYEHSEVMNLVRQIKDVVSEAEDIVELFVVQAVKALDANQVRPSLHLGSVIKKIKTLTAKIKNIYDQNMFDIKGAAGQKLQHSASKSEGCLQCNYRYSEIAALTPEAVPSCRKPHGSSSSGRNKTSKMVEEKDVVGFEKEVDKLLGTLCGNGEGGELEIISIVGAAGGGKTTLATQVYKHSLTSSIFTIRAWVDISQEYDKTKKRDMLIRILGCKDDKESSDDKLGEDVYKYLRDEKYLIVMDDIWSSDAWYDIQRSLPKESRGSKVLFTSRLPVRPNGIRCIHTHHLAPLPNDSSWELLQNKVFGNKSCRGDLVGIGEHIAKKCKGLPLAIIIIAGILAMEDKTVDVWEKVSKNLSSIIMENQAGCWEILELSYNHLPLQLKACFVYIGGFPEDSEILVHELLWLWIAEGFVQPQSEGDKSLEDVAKDYLDNLIDRNLVMGARKKSFRGIKACRIHDVLRELCLKKAEEDDFLVQIYGDHTFSPPATTKHRRLFIGSQSFHEFSLRPCSRNLRSFICLNLNYSKDLSFDPDLSFFVENFELLRVLSFESCLDCGGKIGRGDLVHLRYLSLKIPFEISKFVLPFFLPFNLETLCIKHMGGGTPVLIVLPRNIFKMVKFLRHLYAEDGIFIYHHSCLDHSSKLDNLQTLKRICSCEMCRNFLVSTPNLRNLGFCDTRRFKGSDGSDLISLDLEFLKCLEKLKIESNFWGLRLPPVLKFPPTVTRLSLHFTFFTWEELSILLTALPNLEVLKLLSCACRGPTWNTSELEGFSCSHLKYLRLFTLAIEEWIANEDQFPRLEVLVVGGCRGLKQIPIDFANLNELREIQVWGCNRSAEKSARDIQKEQRDIRGDDGCINLLLSLNDSSSDDVQGENDF